VSNARTAAGAGVGEMGGAAIDHEAAKM